MGLMALIATVTMLFAAFTAALLVRRTGPDWVPIQLPVVTWFNVVPLVLSSLFAEWSRRAIRRGDEGRCAVRLRAAALLGVLFAAGQVQAWRVLAAHGVFLPASPHASFFYMLSAVHLAHLAGGLGALAWTSARAAQGRYTRSAHDGLIHTAVYWHFVAALWIYVLVLLAAL